MKFIIIPMFFLFFSLQLRSQELSSAYYHVHAGIEQDILPYFLKGFNISAWAGMKNTRLRFNYAQANTPKFWMADGIVKERIAATQVAVDFFLKKDFKGFWFGPGLGHWQTSLMTEQQEKRNFPGIVFSAGSGYNWNFYKGFYLSPYIAGHMRISGTKNIEMGTLYYRPSLMFPEISLKLGWKF